MKDWFYGQNLRKTFQGLFIYSLFLLIFFPADQVKNLDSFPRQFFNPSQNSADNELRQRLVPIFSRQSQNYPWPLEIKLKKNNSGQVWILEPTKNATLILRCLDGDFPELFKVKPLNSAFHSFDFILDSFNEPWLVWVESEATDKLWLTSFTLNKALIIDSGPAFSLTSPSLCVDLAGTIWIFWSKSINGLDRIFFSRLSGSSLTSPKCLFDNPNFPCLMPSCQVDASGKLWLTWSAYDGADYEIFVSSYDGQGWSRPQKISSSPNADLLPRLFPSANNNLALIWLEESNKASRLWLTEKRGNNWSKPELLWSDSELINNYEVINIKNELILCLKKGENYYLPFVARKKFGGQEQIEQDSNSVSGLPFLSPNRNDDAYIAFGDSITSGLIKTNLDPEQYYYNGYPPRLEAKLRTEYGAGRVFNEGFDGELTTQGVSRLPTVLNEYNARYLLLMEGFNDVVFTNISLDTVIFNLQTMISQSLQKGVFPLLATITPRRDAVWYQPLYRQRHLTLNERIRQLATSLKIPLVDQYFIMENYPASDGGLLSLLSVDLKHPNEKGYQVIAETWYKEIQVFPFPPRNLKVVGRDFVWDAKFIRFLTSSEFLPGQNQTGLGNFISWEANPKIKSLAPIAGYRLYRKKANESDSAYALIATINDNLHYFDKNVILSFQYSYLVSTYRTDGVEGPAAGPVTR